MTSVSCTYGCTGTGQSAYFAFIGSLSSFRGYLNEEFNQAIVALAESHRWRPFSLDLSVPSISTLNPDGVPLETSWTNVEHRLVKKYGRLPSALLFAVKFHWNYVRVARLGARRDHMPNTQIILLVDDLHWYDQASFHHQYDAIAVADIIFSTYAHDISMLYPPAGARAGEVSRRSQRLAWTPHATTPQIFTSIKDPRAHVNQVLLSGATTRQWYPYRYLVRRWIAQGRDKRFALLDHPGYASFRDNPFIGRGFALQLNRYAACMTDGLQLNYTVAKILEMPAAGCLLLINGEMTPLLARLGFFDSVHFLSYNNASTLIDVVKRVLDPRNARIMHAMRQRAQALVLRRHVVTHRAAEMHSTVLFLTKPK